MKTKNIPKLQIKTTGGVPVVHMRTIALPENYNGAEGGI